MGQLKQIVVDCHHPAAPATFWAAVLDGFQVRAYDDAEIERLASNGRTPETDPCVLLDGPMIEFCFQEILDSSAGKRPLNVDVEVQNRAAETSRLVALGATVVQHFDQHTRMRDPEGNDFCITDPQPALTQNRRPRTTARSTTATTPRTSHPGRGSVPISRSHDTLAGASYRRLDDTPPSVETATLSVRRAVATSVRGCFVVRVFCGPNLPCVDRRGFS